MRYFFSIFVFMIFFVANTSAAQDYADENDKKASAVIEAQEWAHGTYVSPGHMNIAVLSHEKDWKAIRLGVWACATLRENGSSLTRVRFVDVVAVVRHGKSMRQPEISIFRCNDIL